MEVVLKQTHPNKQWYFKIHFVFILAADTCGEKLAWVFGITSPKYQSAIDEYYRVKRQVCFYIVLSLHKHYVTRYLFYLYLF